MKLLRYLSLVLPAIFMSCSEDEPNPTPASGDGDIYEGSYNTLTLHEGCDDILHKEGLTLYISTPDGSVITRDCSHRREGTRSDFSLKAGLKEGEYRLLRLEYDLDTPLAGGKITKGSYGLGCRIRIADGKVEVLDTYSEVASMWGDGTKDSPFIISDSEHLNYLAVAVNDDRTDEAFPTGMYFSQECDLDMAYECFYVGGDYGWIPIGQENTTPFRGYYNGNNHKISGLEINRPNAPTVGLFGNARGAVIENIILDDAEITGNFAVGGILGAVVTIGGERQTTSINGCSVTNSRISGSTESCAVAGIAGVVDQYARLSVIDCTTDDQTSVSSDFGAGGIVGISSMYSTTFISKSNNAARITSKYSGAGGIIACADTLAVSACTNTGTILSTEKDNTYPTRGTGGLVGGSGMSSISASVNYGQVIGHEGVGGIIGSTRVSGDAESGEAYVFNNTMMRYCGNEGEISGTLSVGGLAGEAQFGCYGSYNKGNITATGDYSGGIVGNTSIAVVHNSVNSGAVEGAKYVSGIIGKTTMGSVAIDHNYGAVTASDSYAGGIVGLAGNYSILNYCGNFGEITCGGDGPAGGIVAEVGDPREWTAMNITECVIGSIECAMAVLGPAFSLAAHATEAIAWAHISLELCELVPELVLLATDAVLLELGVFEMIYEEEAELIETEIKAAVSENVDAVRAELESIRGGSPAINSFSPSIISTEYNSNIKALTDFYEGSEENAELFNENINVAREERAKQIAEANHTQEIIHSVVAGVAIICSTVAMIGGAIASGGAAVPFMIAGSAAAVVGGSNAIYKSCTDFADNAVIISQCVNAGYVVCSDTGSDQAGGIVGHLNDKSVVRNCLNAAGGQRGNGGGHFVGDLKQQAILENSLTVANQHYWADLVGDRDFQADTDNLYYCTDDNMTSVPKIYASPKYSYSSYGKGLTTEQVGKAESYENWDIGGEKSPWIIPTKTDGHTLPIPYISEMQLSRE